MLHAAIAETEILNAIANLKANKSAAPDMITGEMLKAASKVVLRCSFLIACSVLPSFPKLGLG